MVDIHLTRELLWAVTQEAARAEQLTVKALRDYVRYLKEARTDPALKFRERRPA